MVLDETKFKLLPFTEWIGGATASFLVTLAILGFVILLAGYLITAFRYGPIEGGDITFGVAKSMFFEFFQLSPRRIWALARLTVQEAIRRRVIAGFAVFLVVLLFAAWFLDPSSNEPARLYLGFVLNVALFLTWAVALLLSVFSIPNDLKNKTIYTIVTKPVHAGEIVLGRIIGFAIVGTVFLAVMGVVSYGFVIRVLSHSHEIAATAEEPSPEKPLVTSTVHSHHHEVRVGANGKGETDTRQGHKHEVTAERQGDKTVYKVGPSEGMFNARVPVYGKLRFLDRAGDTREKGISVGNEWSYRSFIEGRTQAAGIYTFEGVKEDKFPGGVLPIGMTVRVFRTYKADIVTAIRGTLQLRNPDNDTRSEFIFFSAKDAIIDEHNIPRKLTDPSGKKELDLFKDLVTPDGRLEIRVSCIDPAQYFGLARGDMWLRAGDASFKMNYVKGFFGIWTQMLMVIGFGVMFSTFLNGAVAAIATLGAMVLGACLQFIVDIATGKTKGGGPFESMIRIFNQSNMVTEMEGGLTKTVVQAIDAASLFVMERIASLLPDLTQLSNATFVADGFNISGDRIAQQLCTALAYLVGVFFIGYFFLKTREVAR